MDLIHKATKIIDHNRGTAGGAALLILSMLLAGCSAFDGKTVSSSSGELLGADELRAEYVVQSKTLQARYDDATEQIRQAEVDIDSINRTADELGAGYVADVARSDAEVQARNSRIGGAAELIVAAAGIPWLLPLVSLGTTSVAAGAVYDNRRKDRKIKNGEAPQA